MHVFEALKETGCRCLLPRKAGTVSALTHTPLWGVRQCSWVQAHAGAPQVSTRISFLDNEKVLPAPQGHRPGILYTTVLRELRLW